MVVKDFYTILQVAPTATMVEIKKAYRKLAHIYHPDKNANSEIARIHFDEIKTAYDVLVNTEKRRKYNHEIWQRHPSEKEKVNPTTPLEILQNANNLAAHVNSIDVFRMSHEILYFQVKEILSNNNQMVLQHYNDPYLNKKIIETVFKIIKPLDLIFINKLEIALVKIAGTDNMVIQKIHQFIQQKKQQAFWAKYNVYIIVLITALICCLIFLIGK